MDLVLYAIGPKYFSTVFIYTYQHGGIEANIFIDAYCNVVDCSIVNGTS